MNNFKIVSYDIHKEFGPPGSTRHIVIDGFKIALVSANTQTAEGADPVKSHATGHWAVTDYQTAYNDYQIVFCLDIVGQRVFALRCLAHTAKGSHTWKRNTANEGYSFSAMYGAIPTADLKRIAKAGPFPVVDILQQAAGQYLAEYACIHGWDLSAKIDLPKWKMNASGSDMAMLSDSGLSAPILADHAFYARADGYGPDRWDNAELTVNVNAYALQFHDELKRINKGVGSKRTFGMLNIVKQGG